MKNKDNKNLEEKIMGQIKAGQIKLRSKYVFLAEKLGLNSALALSVVLAVLFFNFLFFYLKTAGALEYLSFGRIGFWAFLESFPYSFTIVLILLLLASGFLITKVGWSYKTPFKYFIFSLLGVVFFGGTLLAYTEVPQTIEEKVMERDRPGIFFKTFLSRPFYPGERGVIGKIKQRNQNLLFLETAKGEEKVILPRECCPELRQGDFIAAVGKKNGEFKAEKVKLINKKDWGVLDERIKRCKKFNSACPNCHKQKIFRR